MPSGTQPRGWIAVAIRDELSAGSLSVEVAGARELPARRRLFDVVAAAEGEPVAVAHFDPRLLSATRHLRSGHGSLRFSMPRSGGKGPQPILASNTEGTACGLVQSYLAPGDFKEWSA